MESFWNKYISIVILFLYILMLLYGCVVLKIHQIAHQEYILFYAKCIPVKTVKKSRNIIYESPTEK